MRIQSNFIYSATSVVAFALLAGGCGAQGMDDEGSDSAKLQEEATAEAFDYAPEDQPLTEEEKEAAKEAQAALNQKGDWSEDMNRGEMFTADVYVAAGQTITCETSQYGDKTMDTLLALVRRDDGYVGGFNSPSYEHQARFSTVKFDDDSGPDLYSKFTWTNNGDSRTFNLLGWAFYHGRGQATVQCTFSNPSDTLTWEGYSFTAGSSYYETSCDQGKVTTSSADGGDPYVVVVDEKEGSGDGYWNDDIKTSNPNMNRQSQITGLTNQNVWYIMGGYSQGTSTLICHY